MQLVKRSIATCQFEIKRVLTMQRIAVALVMAGFPPVMLALILTASRVRAADFGVVEFLIVFLVSLVCVLSLLLWATPNVYSELEGKSWIFLASRPQGRIANVLGKFFTSVIFSYAICFIGTSLCILVASVTLTVPDPVSLWLCLNRVFLLGCISFAAVFSLIGTIFYRRAMVVGAAYVIGIEAIIGRIPAVIGKLSGSYHLQQLGMHWNRPLRMQIEDIVGPMEMMPQWIHLLSIAIITCLSLGAACAMVVFREYVSADET